MPLLKEEVEGNRHVCPTDLHARLVTYDHLRPGDSQGIASTSHISICPKVSNHVVTPLKQEINHILRCMGISSTVHGARTSLIADSWMYTNLDASVKHFMAWTPLRCRVGRMLFGTFLPHQENMRVVFGHLWGLWKDLKPSKMLRPHIFWETGTFSFRDMVISERPSRIFQR